MKQKLKNETQAEEQSTIGKPQITVLKLLAGNTRIQAGCNGKM